MPPSSSKVAALRSLLSARFPERSRRSAGVVTTGVDPIDYALGGGLPTSRITEIISPLPGSGGQTLLSQLLHATRAARQRIALIDGANAFSPEEIVPDDLKHLVWIRAQGASEAFAAADILARDGNYAVIVLDLRGLAERTLLKTSATIWHRLRHAAEESPAALLVQTTTALVPAVPRRLVLYRLFSLENRKRFRAELAHGIEVDMARGQTVREEHSA